MLLNKCNFFQVLIKVHACGVNPVETYVRSGNYARLPALPYTPGSDVAGVVESVGEGVTAFKVLDGALTPCSLQSRVAVRCAGRCRSVSGAGCVPGLPAGRRVLAQRRCVLCPVIAVEEQIRCLVTSGYSKSMAFFHTKQKLFFWFCCVWNLGGVL